MGWPKGKPRSEKDRQAISKGLSGEPKPHNLCIKCGKECQKPGRKVRWCSPECRYSDPVYKEELRLRTSDPAWRKRVSDSTRTAMHNPVVRERHLAALEEVFAATENGNNFSGGKGTAPNETMLLYASILRPLGYLMDEVTISRGNDSGRGGHYTLDFALPSEKIDIEIDGTSHRNRQRKDYERDEFLRSLGWKVIRVREW